MPKRKVRDDDDENIPEFNRDLSIIEHAVKFHGIVLINKLSDLKNSGKGDGFNTRGNIEHIPWEIGKAKKYIEKFLGKKYTEIYITSEDIKSLKEALDKLNNYTYPEINKNEYGTVTNWKEIITELDKYLKPIFEEIRESYMKYLPENERNIPFAPLTTNQEEDVEMVSDEEEETVYASVGGRRRKYRKKRTKKRRKSKGRKRRKSRRRKRTRKRRRKKRTKRRRKR